LRDRNLDSLRDDPRFAELMAKVENGDEQRTAIGGPA
jgi:hypothetical protein